MAVYVDDAMIHYRNMLMNHMVADTTEELLDMARAIRVPVKWIQGKGHPVKEHFDICAAKRLLAIKAGAIAISSRELSEILNKRRNK